MKNNVLTFGEVIMRLSPNGNRLMQQSNSLEYFFGGTELNVAASLSNLGLDVKHVSVVSNDFVGDSALSFIKSLGIDASFIQKSEYPLGLYFLEVGASLRPSRITYNRLNGAFANINPDAFNWEKLLQNVDYFHWTGITPGISLSSYQTLKKGLETARTKGLQITSDPAYRSNLWKYGKDGKAVLLELIQLSTIFIGGVNEINEILNTNFENDNGGFIAAAKHLMQEVPSIEKIFDKVRVASNASSHQTQGRAWINENYLETPPIAVDNVVDRIGTGDAFAAGLIYGLTLWNDEKALSFANAACALKHTILGDINYATETDILEVLNGNSGGRIKR